MDRGATWWTAGARARSNGEGSRDSLEPRSPLSDEQGEDRADLRCRERLVEGLGGSDALAESAREGRDVHGSLLNVLLAVVDRLRESREIVPTVARNPSQLAAKTSHLRRVTPLHGEDR